VPGTVKYKYILNVLLKELTEFESYHQYSLYSGLKTAQDLPCSVELCVRAIMSCKNPFSSRERQHFPEFSPMFKNTPSKSEVRKFTERFDSNCISGYIYISTVPSPITGIHNTSVYVSLFNLDIYTFLYMILSNDWVQCFFGW